MTSGPEKDVKEFQFKVSGQLRVFPSNSKLDIESPVKFVATASKYGLVFVGTPSGLTCIITKTILENVNIQSKPLTITSEFPQRSHPLPSQPSHVDVNADQELLAAAVRIQDIAVLQVFLVASFGAANIIKKVELRLSNTAGVRVTDLQWNPGFPNIISAVMSDGSVVLYELKDGSFTFYSLPPTTQARCLCWSPKGKQVVIGTADGSLSQHLPDLKKVKTFPPPFPSASVISVHWPSSFQFIASYINTAVPRDHPVLTIVNVPKGGQISYIKYDSVCFPTLSKRPENYFIHQQTWNLVILGCGNSMELSVLGLEPNTVNWFHWKQEDSTRAELPLTNDKNDVHNLGIALDSSPAQPIQINDSLTVGPMPIVMSLSHDGVLCLFTALNLLPGAPIVCSPPQPFPNQSGLQLFTFVPNIAPSVQPVSAAVSLQATTQAAAPAFSQPPASTFGVFSSATTQSTTQPSSGLFSQPPSFANPVFGSQPVFATTTPSLFSTTSPFSQSLAALPKTTSVFQGLTASVSQASPAVSQAPLTFASVAHSIPATKPPDAPTASSVTIQPVAPTLTPVPSFGGTAQQSPLQPLGALGKQPDSAASTLTSFSLGGFGLDSASVDKKEQSKIEVKPDSIPVSTLSQPILEKPQPEEKPDTTEADNAAYMSAIHEELTSFQDEFTNIKQYLNSFQVKVAEEKVKGELCCKIDSYQEFSKELVETTQAQSAEVSSLKLSLLDVLSWIELIKTKQTISKNPSLIEMREAEEMDPIGKHWCKKIEQRLYGLQCQVRQAVEQMESMKDSSKEGGLYLPTFEAVLQIVINLNKIVNSQKSVLSSIEDKFDAKLQKFKERKRKIIQLNRSARNKSLENDSQLSKLAQKLLQTKLESAEDTELYSYRESSQKMISKGRNCVRWLEPGKEQMLREWHSKQRVLHTKSSSLQQSILVADVRSPLKPVRLSDKKPVSFLKGKLESTEGLVKPVPTTPIRTDNKTVQLNRNLFATPPESASITSGIVPLSQDVKGMFQGGVTSTPLPAAVKKDQLQPNISTTVKLGTSPSNNENVKTSIVTPALTLVKGGVAPFGSVATSQASLSILDKSAAVKTGEVQLKPAEPISKGLGFVSTQKSIFSFGGSIQNKENVSAESIVPVSSPLTSSLFSKPVTKPSSNVFGGFSLSTDTKASSDDSQGNKSVSFNFGSITSSLPASLSIEKTTPQSKIETSVAPPSTQTFSFGSVPAAVSSSVTSSANPLFSFSQSNISTNVTSANQSVTSSSVVKPISSFSFASVASALKPSSTAPVLEPASAQLSAVSSLSITPVTATEAVTPPPAPISSQVTPVQSPVIVSPSATLTPPSSTQPPNTTASVTPVSVSKPATPVFGVATTTTTVSTVAASNVATPTTSVFSTPQLSFGSQSFKPPANPTSTFGTPGFGSFAAPTTSTPSLFGGSALKFSTAATTTASFGGVANSTSAPAPLFSQATTTAASPFGQTVTPTQTPASPFSPASPTAQSTTPGSPFSQAAPAFTTSSFGTPAFGSASVFSSLPSPTFGGAPAFGSSTQSVFGAPATTTASSSLFNTPLFGQQTAGSSSPFGATTGQTSPFTPSSPSAVSSPFGSTSPPANPFFNQSQQPSVFGQPASPGNFGSSGGSLFGGTSFGSTNQSGQFPSTGGIFGGASGGGPFSSGGGQTVGQSGFGSPASFQSPKPNSGGFGSAPVFGTSPSFGGAPAFGSQASFGSPNKVFGSPPAVPTGGGFGGQSNMFENIANQNTMSFGNLAQNQPTNMAPTFGTPQPQNQQSGSSFGGSAFSSWR